MRKEEGTFDKLVRSISGKPLNLNYQGRDFFMTKEGEITNRSNRAYIVQQEEVNNTFQLITKHSVYAYTEEIKKSFITISGGHRVGLGGQAIYSGKNIENIKNILSLNIRIAKEKKGYLMIYLSTYGKMAISKILS